MSNPTETALRDLIQEWLEAELAESNYIVGRTKGVCARQLSALLDAPAPRQCDATKDMRDGDDWAVARCGLVADHLGSHEGMAHGRRWFWNAHAAGIMRDRHPTTNAPLNHRPLLDAPPATSVTLNLRQFSEINRKRCESVEGFNHQLHSWSLSDWFTALVGELGEAANIAKKLNRVRDGIRGNTESPEELRAKLDREVADAFIYLDLLAQSAGIDLSVVVPEVFNAKSAQLGCSIRVVAPPATKDQP